MVRLLSNNKNKNIFRREVDRTVCRCISSFFTRKINIRRILFREDGNFIDKMTKNQYESEVPLQVSVTILILGEF